MTLYLDSSALAKRYVEEPDGEVVATILMSDDGWATGNHTYTEVSIALGRRLDDSTLVSAAARFELDWDTIRVVHLDGVLFRRAAAIGVEHRLRTLDALHLAAAERAGGEELTFATFDRRLGNAARSMGFPVVGI